MVMDFPVARAVALQRVTTMTSVSLDPNASGVNSVICSASPRVLKKAGTSSLPRTPCQGAMSLSGQDAQSTSSVSWSRMNWTSPRPNASYTCWMVSILRSLMMCLLAFFGSDRCSHRAPGRHITETMYSADQLVAMGPGGRLGAVPDPDLDEDVGDVPLDGVHAHREGGRYLGVLPARGQQLDDLGLAPAQRARRLVPAEAVQRIAQPRRSPLQVQPSRQVGSGGRVPVPPEQPVQARDVPGRRAPATRHPLDQVPASVRRQFLQDGLGGLGRTAGDRRLGQ